MTTMCDLVSERRFRVMGTDAHVLVVGPDPTLVDDLVSGLEDLEARWSRFRPTSEVSLLNRRAGSATVVSAPTVRLVEHAVSAWRLTNGRYDPTVLAALEALGYDRSFELVDQGVSRAAHSGVVEPGPAPGPAGIVVDHADGTVTLPVGVGFDPGGIGKGLAADMLVDRARVAGASGALVNVGGDLRVWGRPPHGPSWPVTVHETTVTDEPLARLEMQGGAVATSTTQRRTWLGPTGRNHHLVDPTSGRPWERAARQVTVVAADGWWAEAAATALIAPHAELPPHCAAVVVDHAGRRHELGPIGEYSR